VLLEAFKELTLRGEEIKGKRVLSPGCGTGSDALALAQLGARVLAVDWSPFALADLRARYKERASLEGSIEVDFGDFFALKPRPVDIVAEHTFFCAIDPTARQVYVNRIAEWIAPGGYLVGNFFVLSEEMAGTLPGLSLVPTGEGPPFATTVSELTQLLRPYFEEVLLRPASQSEPDRRPGMEWVGIFRRR
jgi:SAM-dependent methyltransferase